jgi:hypothetical protein
METSIAPFKIKPRVGCLRRTLKNTGDSAALLTSFAVPELTCSTDIKLNRRVSLRPAVERLSVARRMIASVANPQSQRRHAILLGRRCLVLSKS